MPAIRPQLSLDETVRIVSDGLRARGAHPPQVLFLMATGAGLVPEHLRSSVEIALGEIDGVPEPWRDVVLHSGHLGTVSVWILDDVSGEPLEREPRESWTRGLPVWLAAFSGAGVCVHTSAGSALVGADEHLTVGGFGLVRDHLNVSGTTLLVGLGASELGPLFPDQTLVHHIGLRHAALRRAEKRGLPCAEVVAACTAGPALETPAERRMLGRAGADVAVQSLALPLLAAAHAGVAVLAIVAITDAEDASVDVARILETAGQCQPALEDLVLSLTEDLERTVAVLEEDDGP